MTERGNEVGLPSITKPEARTTNAASPAVTPRAIYVDGQGDAWIGMEDGTLSALEQVPDEDRYSSRNPNEVAVLWNGLTCVWTPDE